MRKVMVMNWYITRLPVSVVIYSEVLSKKPTSQKHDITFEEIKYFHTTLLAGRFWVQFVYIIEKLSI
jgi:hypothetical protein